MKQTIRRYLNVTVLLSLLMFHLLSNPGPVSAAADIIVTTQADEAGTGSACSLREAVISANENRAFGGCRSGSTGVDTIRVPASNKTYSLTLKGADNTARGGDLDILGSVQILGGGADNTIISGASAADRVFNVRTTGTVQVSNITITGGDYVLVGGGVFVEMGRVTFSNVVLAGNHAQSAGGGMMIKTGASATMNESIVSNNTASQAGGIINEGNLFLNNSLVIQNKGSLTTGGIISNTQGDAETTKITNSTIAQNDAPTVAGISVTTMSRLVLLNSTITDNLGIGLEIKQYGKAEIMNTIIARQKRNDPIDNCLIDPRAEYASSGHNLSSDATCEFSSSGDMVVPVEDLGLDGLLADNGGPTLTYAIIEKSPAVDTGNNQGCPYRDQRGLLRPAAGKTDGGSLTCDIGAFELNGISGLKTYIPAVQR